MNLNRTSNELKYQFTNVKIAEYFDKIAELIEAQQAHEYRVRAYRQAAATLRTLEPSVQDILANEGVAGLQALPTIGVSLANAIAQLSTTGKITLLEQLLGKTTPERIFASIPGIGPILAGRIHDQLHIESLAELRAATYDGRLASIPGFGAGRLRAVRETLAGRFRLGDRQTTPMLAHPPPDQPPVSELLDVDREYRKKAGAGRLPYITPRRFNPTGAAWLPILHTERDTNHYTALFSNTARAHELGTTKDWVVIYRDDHGGTGQWTVITSQYGALQGQRIVRGREAECRAYYDYCTTNHIT